MFQLNLIILPLEEAIPLYDPSADPYYSGKFIFLKNIYDKVKYKNNIQLIDKIDKLSIYLYFIQSGNTIYRTCIL